MRDANKLHELISACAEHLQALCLQRTASIYGRVRPNERKSWRAPPLRSPLTLGPVPLEDMLANLYWHDISLELIKSTWDQVPGLLLGTPGMTRPLQTLLQTALPSVPFTPQERKDTHSMLAQFIYACSLSNNRLRVSITSDDASLRASTLAGPLELSLTRRAIMTSRGAKRAASPSDLSFTKALRIPLGGELDASLKLTGVFNVAVAALPELHEEIQLLCAIVVAAGRPFELTLTSLFDIEEIPDDDPDDNDVWAKARKLITTSTLNPCTELHDVLLAVVDHNARLKAFGPPGRQAVKYSDQARAKHLAALAVLEYSHPGGKQKKRKSVSDMLELQNLLK